MATNRPYYVLFAGVNGAGKSTLFHSDMWQHGGVNTSLPRVNSDEILVENGWDPNEQSAQIRAGRIALARIKELFDACHSFNQETTLTGKSILRNIHQAHEMGYYIVVYYVGLENPEIANKRIAHRGETGGHLIDPKTVQRRYQTSLDSFISIVDLCNEAYLFDNTTLLRLCARFEFGELAFYNETSPQLQWVTALMERMGFEEVPFPNVD